MSTWGSLEAFRPSSARHRRLAHFLEGVDLSRALADSGVPHNVAGGDARLPCPEHHEGTDRDVALRLGGERKGRWHCWYPGCDQKGYVDGLLRRLLAVDRGEAERLLGFYDEEAGLPPGTTGALDWQGLLAVWSDDRPNIFRQSEREPPPPPRGLIGTVLRPAPLFRDARLAAYLRSPERGFADPEPLIETYGMALGHWATAGEAKIPGLRLFLPVWDRAERYRGWAARSLDGRRPKMLYPAGFPSAELLYPEWQIAELLTWDAGRIVLVEGPFDALKAQVLGIPALATFGSKLTERQGSTLFQAGATSLVLAYDGDAAGRAGMREAWGVIAGRLPLTWVAFPPGHDPGNLRCRADWEALSPAPSATLWSS